MRFQAALLLGGVLWILIVLAMASHDRLDPAFTTSGQHAVPHNWVGQLGAYVSDILQMLLGHSAWWLPLVGLRVWLGALALWMLSSMRRIGPPAGWPRGEFGPLHILSIGPRPQDLSAGLT